MSSLSRGFRIAKHKSNDEFLQEYEKAGDVFRDRLPFIKGAVSAFRHGRPENLQSMMTMWGYGLYLGKYALKFLAEKSKDLDKDVSLAFAKVPETEKGERRVEPVKSELLEHYLKDAVQDFNRETPVELIRALYKVMLSTNDKADDYIRNVPAEQVITQSTIDQMWDLGRTYGLDFCQSLSVVASRAGLVPDKQNPRLKNVMKTVNALEEKWAYVDNRLAQRETKGFGPAVIPRLRY